MTWLTREHILSRPQMGTLTIRSWRTPGKRVRSMTFTTVSGEVFEVPADVWEFAVSPEATASELATRSRPLVGRHRR